MTPAVVWVEDPECWPSEKFGVLSLPTTFVVVASSFPAIRTFLLGLPMLDHQNIPLIQLIQQIPNSRYFIKSYNIIRYTKYAIQIELN